MERSTRLRISALALGVLGALGIVGSVEVAYRKQEAATGLVLDFDEPGRKYAMRPNHSGTNSQGFNERELPFEKPEGTYRVVVLGDSVTFGGGVDKERVYPRVAERRLSELGLPFELVNLSVYGYDVEQIAATMKYRGWAYEPDLVVYAWFTNDALPSEILQLPDGGGTVFVGTNLEPSDAIGSPELSLELCRWSAFFRRVLGARVARNHDEDRLARGAGDEDWFDGHFDSLVADVRAHQVPLIVFGLASHVLSAPTLEACAERTEQQGLCARQLDQLYAMQRKAVARGLPFVDAVSYYRRAPTADLFLPGLDDPHHPNTEGHRLLGEGLAEALVQWMGGDRFLELPPELDAAPTAADRFRRKPPKANRRPR